MEAYEQNKTVEFQENYVEDCRIPKQFQNPVFDARCRTWYTISWNRPGESILATYLSIDETKLLVTISKRLQDSEGRPFGVAAMDIDTSFLPSVLNTQTIEGV